MSILYKLQTPIFVTLTMATAMALLIMVVTTRLGFAQVDAKSRHWSCVSHRSRPTRELSKIIAPGSTGICSPRCVRSPVTWERSWVVTRTVVS